MCEVDCVFTYFPMFSGRTCNEISLIERHVRFLSSGKLSGNLGKKKINQVMCEKPKEEFIKEHFSHHLPITINMGNYAYMQWRIHPHLFYHLPEIKMY